MLTTIDRSYTAAIAPRARGWIEPFLASFADIQMEVGDRARRELLERNRSRDPFVYAVARRRGT
jgi:hypothetical protein